MCFSENIKKRRKELGITQSDLAEQIGVKQNYISQIEKGVCVPSLSLTVSIAKVLKTSVDSLIEFYDE